MELLLRISWMSTIILFFTVFLVSYDRAFSKRIRAEFQLTLFLCVVLSIIGQYMGLIGHDEIQGLMYWILYSLEAAIRPVVLLMMIYLTEVWDDKASVALMIPAVANLVLAVLAFWAPALIIFCFYTLVLILSMYLKNTRGDKADIVFAYTIIAVLLTSIGSEYFLDDDMIMNNAMGLIVCVFYYYMVMRTYKKDGLTGLLIRHNLKFEMEDMKKKAYDVVLIDVDNFKQINDTYGHDRGDEVLVTIVNTIRTCLPRHSRMFRYGGDEFVVLNSKGSAQQLDDAMRLVNEQLAGEGLSVSYGLSRHEPGEESLIAIVAADQAMYENKRNRVNNQWN